MFLKPLLISLSCMGLLASNAIATSISKPSLENPYFLSKSTQVSTFMTLTPTQYKNTLGNPLYQLTLYVNNKPIAAYYTVTGRKYTQNRNRHKSGTEAPLPDGIYKVAKSPVPGTIPEAGGRFLPIEPLFQTRRSALGIHYDPSYEKRNGEDGTSGCIALTNKRDLTQFLNYIRIYQPQYLKVDIQ